LPIIPHNTPFLPGKQVTRADTASIAPAPNLHKDKPNECKQEVNSVQDDCDVVKHVVLKPDTDLVDDDSREVQKRQVKTESDCHLELLLDVNSDRS